MGATKRLFQLMLEELEEQLENMLFLIEDEISVKGRATQITSSEFQHQFNQLESLVGKKEASRWTCKMIEIYRRARTRAFITGVISRQDYMAR